MKKKMTQEESMRQEENMFQLKQKKEKKDNGIAKTEKTVKKLTPIMTATGKMTQKAVKTVTLATE